MKVKKITAIIVMSILLTVFAACGNGGADIPIAKLEFGMSEKQVKNMINAVIDEERSDSAFPVYIGTVDIDGGFRDCMFVFDGENYDEHLCEIFLSSDDMTREDCFAFRDRLIENLSGSYGVSEDDWDIEDNGYKNFLNYKNENGRLIQLYIRLYDINDSSSLTMIFKSGLHSFSAFYGEEYIDSAENIPVIPKS